MCYEAQCMTFIGCNENAKKTLGTILTYENKKNYPYQHVSENFLFSVRCN
jgi:hypothetical protein